MGNHHPSNSQEVWQYTNKENKYEYIELKAIDSLPPEKWYGTDLKKSLIPCVNWFKFKVSTNNNFFLFIYEAISLNKFS